MKATMYVCPQDEICCLISSCNFHSISQEKILQLSFLDGNHTVTSHLMVSNFNSVIIGPLGDYTPSIVICRYRITFEHISSLTMSDVSFLDCPNPSTVSCQESLVFFQYIPYLSINTAAFVMFESYCDHSLRVLFAEISNLTITDVSFIGYQSLSTVIDIFRVESVVFQEATFQYANAILIGNHFNIVNSHANFLMLEMCTPADEPATQIAIVGSVLNETLITRMSAPNSFSTIAQKNLFVLI